MNLNNIQALMIFEVIGKPPEHLNETLNEIIDKIGEEKGVEIKEKKVNEPALMKDQSDFYSNFAEVEIGVDSIPLFAALIFKYMPAHIEIISPENIKLTNNGMNDIFNELMRKLHGYDEIARVVEIEKRVLEKKLKDLLEKIRKDREEGEKEEKREEDVNEDSEKGKKREEYSEKKEE